MPALGIVFLCDLACANEQCIVGVLMRTWMHGSTHRVHPPPLHRWVCGSQRQSMDLCRQVRTSTDSILPTILVGSSWLLYP